MDALTCKYEDVKSKLLNILGKIVEMGSLRYGEWEWNLIVDQARLDEEKTTHMPIRSQILMEACLTADMKDQLVWWKHRHGFTSKRSYVVLCDQIDHQEDSIHLPESTLSTLDLRTKIPSNVQIFCWSLILNLLPTIDQLARRGILTRSHDTVCPFCFNVLKTTFMCLWDVQLVIQFGVGFVSG